MVERGGGVEESRLFLSFGNFLPIGSRAAVTRLSNYDSTNNSPEIKTINKHAGTADLYRRGASKRGGVRARNREILDNAQDTGPGPEPSGSERGKDDESAEQLDVPIRNDCNMKSQQA